ncbi:hypothetical protein COT78_02010 [Candidatus Berkelbacteria bacterium CG10_big_fil_rev_8_21_14_0_10_43_13]|uniref:Uncharacterized protein n=1 Tax=Candidatus Berkelbacteria bacterium CG10_big_fil_rev_8_21_14_0_10_43_13 TaxID=1974514 RepID=A0A2H0W6J3_9BACT|nr:MAG: hypothetical protein COT78_02010 [Candidatus Berkelbacteria bacterium CG10_big_fil_rev_8_21_14_0_10_43_13]
MPQVLINWLNLERFFKLGGLVDQIIDTGNRVEFDVDDVLDIFGYEWAELSDDDQNRLGTIVTEFASPHELIIQRTEEKCIILTD